jgi:hypothetical protein
MVGERDPPAAGGDRERLDRLGAVHRMAIQHQQYRTVGSCSSRQQTSMNTEPFKLPRKRQTGLGPEPLEVAENYQGVGDQYDPWRCVVGHENRHLVRSLITRTKSSWAYRCSSWVTKTMDFIDRHSMIDGRLVF